MSIIWKLNRLSAMEPAEIAWRIRQTLRTGLERCGLFAAHAPVQVDASDGAAWLGAWPTQFNIQKYRAAADRILDGDFNVFAMKPAHLGFPPRWNRDPKTGRDAPLKFGKLLDYRKEQLVGDIKYLWEPSRHAELVTLAQAWRLTGDDRYSVGCRTLLDSWFEQCPYRLGPHWISSLEHAVRLLNWSLAWQLLGGSRSPLFSSHDGLAFQTRWLASIYQHCHFIAGHFSRFSSANNHLLGELTGLFVATLTWPCWSNSARWRDAARREIEAQALLQNGGDGVNREQAVWYHHEVADMMLITALVGRTNGLEFSAEYWRRLEAMLEFLASIMDSGGNVPAFGDSDDAVIVRLDPDEHVHVYSSLLATGAVLFERADFAFKAARFDDKTRWLMGDAAAARFYALRSVAPTQLPVRRAFVESGYYILGDRFESSAEVRIIFDAGPLGYRSIAAHGHADALSFTLSAGGSELLIDPGTFAYHTQKCWRDYFRGTSAHNTLRIDGMDQSRSGGNFLWLTHARARVLEFLSLPEIDCIVAEHDGYQRLSDPVLHRRELHLDRASMTLRVIDDLFCASEHDVEMYWHFSEDSAVELLENRASVRRANVEMGMIMPAKALCEIFSGSQEPTLGWTSRHFDERGASPTLRARLRICGDTRLVTDMTVVLNGTLTKSAWPQPLEDMVTGAFPSSALRRARDEKQDVWETGGA